MNIENMDKHTFHFKDRKEGLSKRDNNKQILINQSNRIKKSNAFFYLLGTWRERESHMQEDGWMDRHFKSVEGR